MKKRTIRVLIAVLALLIGVTGCTNGKMTYPMDRYDLDAYMIPYWSGNTVYQESVMPLENEDGTMDDISLLYKADKILSVRSSALDKEYVEGKDYELADGKLRILGGDIPRVAYSQYYPMEPSEQAFTLRPDGEAYVLFSEGAVFHNMQIAVTYTHSESFDGSIPAYQGTQLPKTIAKLNNNEPLTILLYGDSISVGGNSTQYVNAAPYAPIWPEMALAKLADIYGNTNIHFVNTSESGQNSIWGVENAQSLAADKKPDLAIIAFGMNDGSGRLSASDFCHNISAIMDTIKAENAACEFILVAPMLANPEARSYVGNQELYASALREIAGDGAVVADMTQYHKNLLAHKRYMDMTGNNVNHPNDFLARAYAQVITRTLAENYG